MPGHEAARRARGRGPARARLADRARVVAAAVYDHESVTAVRVDRDVAAGAGLAVAHEAGRVEWRAQQAAAVERVGDRAGAVVAAVLEGAVAASVAVGRLGDRVRAGHHA